MEIGTLLDRWDDEEWIDDAEELELDPDSPIPQVANPGLAAILKINSTVETVSRDALQFFRLVGARR